MLAGIASCAVVGLPLSVLLAWQNVTSPLVENKSIADGRMDILQRSFISEVLEEIAYSAVYLSDLHQCIRNIFWRVMVVTCHISAWIGSILQRLPILVEIAKDGRQLCFLHFGMFFIQEFSTYHLLERLRTPDISRQGCLIT